MQKRLAVSLCFCVILLTSSVNVADEAKPNVVLILIDDLNHYGVTAYGANRISEKTGTFTDVQFETPNIDRLARTGVRCDNAFAYPLCEATRIALMSGQYNSRNFLRPKAQHASDLTFGDTFKQAGYATGVFGKWKQSRGTKEVPGKDYIFEFGWDEFCCFDVTDESQRFINPLLVVNGKVQDYRKRTDTDPRTDRRWYGPDICNYHALDFIDRNKDQPFFLYYPMILVHAEHKPTPDTLPKTLFDNCDESKSNDDLKFFPDMLSYMDKLIGNIVSKLEEHDLRDNTLIVVMGDNGTKEPFVHVLPDGSKYGGGKGGTKKNGLQVPLVISWPAKVLSGGAMEHRRYDGLVDIVDIYPTIADAANVDIQNDNSIDGISFWPQVCGKSTGAHRDHIYTWYNANYHASDLSKLERYAFDKNFKRYAPDENFPNGRFFDLRNDPFEDAGERKVKLRWKHFHKSGLELDRLTFDQQAAFERLGKVLEANEFVSVSGLKIDEIEVPIKVGSKVQLLHEVLPRNATRQNVIWESSDNSVATVNKFGQLKALSKGEVQITLYSWDDALPLASNQKSSYRRNGIQDSIIVTVN